MTAALLGGDVQRRHGDGYHAVRAAERVVHDEHASRDQPAGDGVAHDAR